MFFNYEKSISLEQKEKEEKTGLESDTVKILKNLNIVEWCISEMGQSHLAQMKKMFDFWGISPI